MERMEGRERRASLSSKGRLIRRIERRVSVVVVGKNTERITRPPQ